MYLFQHMAGIVRGIPPGGRKGPFGLSYPDLAGVLFFLVLAIGVAEFSLSWNARWGMLWAGGEFYAPEMLSLRRRPGGLDRVSERPPPSARAEGRRKASPAKAPPAIQRAAPATRVAAAQPKAAPPARAVPPAVKKPASPAAEERKPRPTPSPPAVLSKPGSRTPLKEAPVPPPEVSKPSGRVELASLRVPEPRELSPPPLRLRGVMRDVWEIFQVDRLRMGSEVFHWDPERDVVAVNSLDGPGRAGENGSAGFRTLTVLRGEIEGSLYQSVVRSGGSGALALAVAEVLNWSVDFGDLRKGDRFSIVAEQRIRNSHQPQWGRVIAVELKTQTEEHRAIGFPSAGGQLRYFGPQGNPVHNHFLSAPVDYTHISSGYSNRRYHPILKVHRPHRGIDYAAPEGTPVRAVADGVVAKAGWAGEGGKTVEIRHGGKFTTRYHHLSRYAKGLRRGQRVSRSQVIGYVGATGLATGPHLDFRVLRNGRPINPLMLKRVAGEPLQSEEKDRFFRVRDAFFKDLNSILRGLGAHADGRLAAAQAIAR